MVEPFLLGINDLYADRLREVSHERVRGRLSRIAGLGSKAVRLLLPWNELQPEAHRVPDTILRRVEAYLDGAGNAELCVELVFFCWRLGERNWLPDWMCDAPPPIRRPRDFYGERELIRAQQLQVSVVAEAFVGHEALLGWDLGRETSDLAHAPSVDAARSRILWLLEALRRRDETHPVTVTLSRGDFEEDRGSRPSGLSEELDFLSLRSSHEDGSGGVAEEDTVGFFSVLARALSKKPIRISELELSTRNDSTEIALESARASGAWGAFVWGGEADADDGLADPMAESFLRCAVSAPERVEPPIRLEVDETAFYGDPVEGIRVAYEAYRRIRGSKED